MVEKTLAYFASHKKEFLEDLKELVRIPSVSFDGFPKSEVRRCADAVVALFKRSGLENIEILDMPGTHPYVYADWLHAPGKPTVLLYAHHDVQPPGDETRWKTPPFEPIEKDGRLYGRGTADDKAGISVPLSAVVSFLKTEGRLPVNVKFIIEGEEEVGSGNLGDFVRRYSKKLQADVMVLTDASNFDTGVPALTVSLRGLVVLQVEVTALEHALHSGMWGGPIPDPAMALCRMLATIVDDKGRLALSEMWKDVRSLTTEEKKALQALPYTESDFRKQSSLVTGVQLLPASDGKVNVYAQMWREPSFVINALEVSSRKQAANAIAPTAWARIGIRTVPDMDPEKTMRQLKDHLSKITPWGLQVKLTPESTGKSWGTRAEGPVFETMLTAMEKGYGVKPVLMGCGGTIPFVEPLADSLGGIPALLIGVEDPYTNAHSENESMDLKDWESGVKTMVHFFSNLI